MYIMRATPVPWDNKDPEATPEMLVHPDQLVCIYGMVSRAFHSCRIWHKHGNS